MTTTQTTTTAKMTTQDEKAIQDEINKIVNSSDFKDYIYREIRVKIGIEHHVDSTLSKEKRKELKKRHEQVWNHVLKCEFSQPQTTTVGVGLFSDILALGEKRRKDKVDTKLRCACVYERHPKKKSVRLIAFIHRDDFIALTGLEGEEFTSEWRRLRFMKTPEILVDHCVATMEGYLSREYYDAQVDYDISEREYREVCEVGPKAIHSDMD